MATEPVDQAMARRAWEGGKHFLFCRGIPHPGKPAVVVEMFDLIVQPEGLMVCGCGVKEILLGEVLAEDGAGGQVDSRVYFDPSRHEVPAEMIWTNRVFGGLFEEPSLEQQLVYAEARLNAVLISESPGLAAER
mmetsp:Transcript_142374/g.442710  ORF Transcript_142374/g.442710 Transcript_142374/m.442710 type:complete len:134 (+) Transcript_142374:479-880(+)